MSDNSLTQIGQISVNAADIPRAVAFYRDTLGMKFLFQASQMAFFDCNGVRLMLSLPEKPEFNHPGSVIYYKVGDINQVYEAFLERGVSFISEPHVVANMGSFDIWMAFFRDTEGNTLAITSDVPNGN
ncbi:MULTISPECIES: VOC family protein [unclassified Paenibacillus]|uniref:VOC family protein n=1 Tax=unclassified Paenibacillus TaxID=185978 RepID=UPI00278832BC|nr:MULTISPECIES: VOC family protein [unclassified Paenibacillus]MDQ0901371.1 putative enzyme related to lactoylglutathione lyase [Paenibacillus sp. V4I7]MDQ0920129.1 putative enzyme related to lactoylglutathione lyase [Paenibacillus sp. V4I5]